MLTVSCNKGDQKLLKIIKNKPEAVVSSVYNHSLNILVNNNKLLLTIADISNGYLPLSILAKVERGLNFQQIGLSPGLKVLVSPEALLVQDKLKLEIRHCNWVSNKIANQAVSLCNLIENIGAAETRLRMLNNGYGLSNLMLYIDDIIKHKRLHDLDSSLPVLRAVQILNILFGSLERGQQYLVFKTLPKLIGFGFGATPSGDDILLGIVVSIKYMNKTLNSYGATIKTDLLKETIKANINKTTLISKKYLLEALKGNISEKLSKYMEAILFKNPDQVKEELEKLFSVGASSGKEILIGTLLGLKFSIDQCKYELERA